MVNELDEILNRAYDIADRMVKPWKCITCILSAICLCLLIYIMAVPTKASVDLYAEDLQAALLDTDVNTQSK